MTSAEQHFATDARGTPTAPGRYVRLDSVRGVELARGLLFQPALGERMLINLVSFDPQTEAPQHMHEEEQIVFVLDGEIEFDIDGDVRVMTAGDAAVIPAWVPHGARTHDAFCHELDIFSPPRKTLVGLISEQTGNDGD